MQKAVLLGLVLLSVVAINDAWRVRIPTPRIPIPRIPIPRIPIPRIPIPRIPIPRIPIPRIPIPRFPIPRFPIPRFPGIPRFPSIPRFRFWRRDQMPEEDEDFDSEEIERMMRDAEFEDYLQQYLAQESEDSLEEPEETHA